MKQFAKQFLSIIFVVLAFAGVCFCASACKKNKKPKLPSGLQSTEQNGATEPVISVYNTSSKTIEKMPIENYVAGVVAGEMPNDFPAEALKAQAILARTYTLYFVANKSSKYKGADISNDITEAQAYAPQNINDAIIEAVAETQGKVLSVDGQYIEAWFHSNSGGQTATTAEGFSGSANQPEFVKSVSSPETSQNAQNTVWSTYLLRSEILSALKNMGKNVDSVSKISVGTKGPSGRAITLVFGNTTVSAPEFRLAAGSTKIKSTLFTNIAVDSKGATFSGKGYGHGVGLSQWGAKVLAEKGSDAEDILHHYYKNINISDLY